MEETINLNKWENMIFRGKLVSIRPLKTEDEVSLKQSFSSDLFVFYPYVYKNCLDFINSVLQLKENGDFFPWVVVENRTGNCIGSSSCASIDFNNKKCEMGWTWFGSEFHGNGYNTEVKLLLFEFLFEKEHFNRVELKADELNVKSNLAMQKLGLVKEGCFRNI